MGTGVTVGEQEQKLGVAKFEERLSRSMTVNFKLTVRLRKTSTTEA
jgi:hypothetical protein